MAVNFSEFKRMSHVSFLAKIVIYLLLILSGNYSIVGEKWYASKKKSSFLSKKTDLCLCQAKVDERRNVLPW